MIKKFVAYKGQIFTIEWYYDAQGKSAVFDYYVELSAAQKEKLIYLFYMLSDTGRIKSKEKFRYEGDRIYAFKPAPDRFLCFFNQDSKIIITNGFEKKSDKLPPAAKQKALKYMEDYKQRCEEDSYYD